MSDPRPIAAEGPSDGRPPGGEPVPARICGYAVRAALASTQATEPDFLGPSYLADGPGGRGVVLKPLDGDCLYKTGLHPSIKERLARVRELALGGVANLYGVERDRPPEAGPSPATTPASPSSGASFPSLASPPAPAAAPAWLVWEHLPGRTFAEHAADPACSQRALASAARELVLVVEALHRQGIVHGAIRGSNAVVDARGNVRLTHVSPLLYTDPGDDVWGVLTTLADAVGARGEDEGPLGQLLAEVRAWVDGEAGPAPAPDAALRALAARLAGVIEARDPVGPPAAADEPPATAAGPGRRSLAAAAAVALLGGGAALAIWWFVRRPTTPAGGWVQSAWEAWR